MDAVDVQAVVGEEVKARIHAREDQRGVEQVGQGDRVRQGHHLPKTAVRRKNKDSQEVLLYPTIAKTSPNSER
eukprot:scaffold314063_cov46-Prasinocladus_malaysianus.AAC.1